MNNQVGDAIKALRIKHGLTQIEFARRTGLKQPAVAYIEGGKRVPNPKMLSKIARAFGKRLVIMFK